jgi:hypothetical protein
VKLRRRLLAVLSVAALPLPVVGCGVPSSGPPVVVKDAPRNGAPSNSDSVVTKKSPAGANDAQELVKRYLKAVAWGNDTSQDPDATEKAASAAKEFMTADAQSAWQRGQEITIVRAQLNLPTSTANGIRVEVSMQPIGVLNSRGAVDPRPNRAPLTHTFMVVPEEHGRGLRIANPPQGMLLSDEGLDNLYEVQPIYFWDTFNRGLVPDLRYLNRSLSPAKRLVQLTGWLRDGPSEYLKPAVNPLPAAIEIKDWPVLDATPGGVRINLSAKAASVQGQLLAKFVLQVRWSLRSLASTVELQIEGQRQELGRDAGRDNPAAAPDGQKEPPRFAIVDGRVRQLAGDPIAVPALASDDNTGVVSAAILRGPGQQVALVREEAPGRLRLWLGSYNQGTRVAQYAPTDLVAETMSRPVGLTTPPTADPAFLVAADGRLWAVSVTSKQPVDRTPAGFDAVTAVSVARDGRRVAVVAGGRVYAGVLTFEGSSPSVAQLEEVQTTLSDAVGVAWSREEWLVVAGRSAGQSALVELTVDSALVEQMPMRNLAGLNVTRVVADPSVRRDDPSRGERGPIMIEANGHAYRVFSGSVDEYSPETSPTPTPSPTPAPSGSPAKQSLPSAPFFLD